MPIADIETLLGLLASNEALGRKGLQFTRACGILVERGGHARGLWRRETKTFSWTPAGYNEPTYWAESPEAAVEHTLTVL